ncbi:hypothetical protein [Photobacterium kishitanii]|uniref:hypothetical protein n=1 Tax=Photobacterium kishitanii TaxID=318456 RepID=UPI00071AF158|nr:hypothetical protein [Photobacterium kishitanii]
MAFYTEIKLNIKDKYDAFIAVSYIEEDKDIRIRRRRDIEKTQNNLLHELLLEIIEEFYNYNDRPSIIKDINNKIKNNKLSNDDLNIIDKNNRRLINWIYCFLKKEKTLQFKENEPRLRIRFNCTEENGIYNIRLNEVVSFIKEVNLLKPHKIIFMKKLISEYSKIYKSDMIELWINKNHKDKIIPWAFDYIKKEIDKDIEDNLFNISSLPDKHDLILSFFDSCEDVIYKKYHISNMKKAWNQKKLREKNKERKAYSFVMDKDIHKKLDFLSDLCGKTKNEVVQELIKEKYYSLQNKN